MGKLLFCYWDLRGLGAPAVNMLEYGGIDYEHKLAGEEWFKEKFDLGLDFPNLPYIVDGDLRLTESWAIYRYIGKKVGLVPSGEKEESQSDMLQGVIQDIRSKFSNSCYNPEFYSLVPEIRVAQEKKFDLIEKYLKTRQFLIGDKLSYLDFALHETLDHHRIFFTDIFAKYPNIEAYMKRFEAVDKVAAFFKSDRYHQFPINGGMAMWGGQKENDKKEA